MSDQVDVCEVAMASTVTQEETSEELDERIATMLHMQQLQQKQEVNQLMESHTVTNADAEFRRGLEELVRDHLNTCMALASCSSAHDPGISSSSNSSVISHASSFNSMHDDTTDTHLLLDDDCNLRHYHSPLHRDDGQSHHADGQTFQTGDSGFCNGQYQLLSEQDDEEENNTQLVRGQGDLNGNLIDHPHSEDRPQSRILSRWAAHHAQEMITTMERQAREAELLALAGLHTVSMLDASFLRESPGRPEPAVGSVERPRRRASSVVQMWRELEEERRVERARTELEDRMALRIAAVNFSEGIQEADNHLESPGVDAVAEHGIAQEEIDDLHHETLSSDRDQTEASLGEPGNVDYREWEVGEMDSRNEVHGNTQELEGDSSQIGEGEREHVRQIVQRLTTDSGMREGSSRVVPNENRAAWLDENERERVRELAREWVRVTNQQRVDVWEGRGGSPGRQELQSETVRGQTRERETALDTDIDQNSRGGLSRDERRLRDRQLILDLLMRIESERQRELQHLLEHRAVSDFAHRNRLQSLLRGRFLRNGAISEEERPPSSAAGELGQLRQRRAVTGLREGFRFRLETILQGQAHNRSGEERTNVQDEVQRRRVANQQVSPISRGVNRVGNREAPSEGVSRDWQGIAVARRVAELQTLEEATAYNMELQELLGRRSVTNVLASEFRDRLDQLIRSFIHSQGRTPVAWDFRRSGRRIVPPQQQPQQQPQPQPQPQPQQGQQQAQNGTERMINTPQGPPVITPPPPPPPPPQQPLWQQELQQATWPRPALHRPSYMELESINELRSDVSKLQQGMSDLHRMMETCMEMQLELQRSVKQEVAGALQRMYVGKAVPEDAIDGSKWVTVKRGICCVCCDKNIDSLLYRCGHMCTCLNCASELIRNSGKCPMCRAPIVEVVRAFTVA